MKPVKLRVVAEIEPMNILQEMSYEEAMEFICAIDLAFADAGFTEQLIIRLMESMRNDLSESDWSIYEKFLNGIKKL